MQFRLGNIPVKIHTSFFVMALILGATGDRDPMRIAIWVGIVAASVFAHELGHAMMGRAFGLAPAIELYAMGGLTSWPQGKDISNGKRVAISLAGPGVGLVVALLLMITGAVGLTPNVSLLGEIVGDADVQRDSLALMATRATLFVNGLWSIFNLLPMMPLDGGNVTLHTLNAVTSGRGERPARIISLVMSVLVGLAALLVQQWWILILSVSFAVQNGRALGQASKLRQDDPLRRVLEKAVSDLNTGNPRAAMEGSELVANQAESAELKLEALRVLAYALVADGRWSQLMQLLEGGLARAVGDDDLARFEQAARDSGSRESGEAIERMRIRRTAPAGDFHAG